MTASPPPVLPDQRLAAGTARLAARHAGRFSVETVQHLLTDSYTRLAATAQVRTHLVVLAERLAAERLDALAHVREEPGAAVPRVLFVCSHNAGRSQMAAALRTLRAGGRVIVSSAGTDPAAEVEPEVAQVLAEAGVALKDAFPKPLTDEVVQAADIVVTMGCGDARPVVPGRRSLDWPVPDPDGAPHRGRPRDPRRDRHAHHRAAHHPARGLTPPGPSSPPSEEELMSTTAPAASVLFVCVHNAGRSQMAAGFLSHLAGDRIEVRSAGSIPAEQVNPAAVEAMKEVGIDISEQKPKVLTTEAVQASDYVITMGCGDACPIFPGKKYLDWALEDPAGKGVEAVRPIRDEIKARIEALVAEIDAKQEQ